jgi:hypothetical protein
MANSFLLQCRENYFEGITPSNIETHEKEGYKRIVSFAKECFNDGKYEEFASGFMEGQYLISLWVAHMLIEYGTPNKGLLLISINTIKRHANSSLAPNVAEEEKGWLIRNTDKYKEYI